MSPQTQSWNPQLPGSTLDIKTEMNPVLNPRAAGPEGSLIGIPGSNQSGNNLTLKGWPLTGAVGLRMRVYGRIMCFVNCHFAAHLEAVNRRNADFDHVYRTMIFSRPSNLFNAAAAGVSSSIQMLCGVNAMGINSVEGIPELSQVDMVVFLGDFNYRLDDISYDEARDFVSQRCFDWLRERDQLQAEMKAGNVFQGMREAVIRFPPTYKFERHQAGLAGVILLLVETHSHFS